MDQARQTEWRPRGGVLALRLLPAVACVVVGSWALVRAGRFGASLPSVLLTDQALPYALLTVEALVLATGWLAVTVRTRVRVLRAGVEVRELRTRIYRWADIRWVEATRGHRAVRLGFRDGSARTLPVPRRLTPGVADHGIDGCVASVRHHAPHRH